MGEGRGFRGWSLVAAGAGVGPASSVGRPHSLIRSAGGARPHHGRHRRPRLRRLQAAARLCGALTGPGLRRGARGPDEGARAARAREWAVCFFARSRAFFPLLPTVRAHGRFFFIFPLSPFLLPNHRTRRSRASPCPGCVPTSRHEVWCGVKRGVRPGRRRGAGGERARGEALDPIDDPCGRPPRPFCSSPSPSPLSTRHPPPARRLFGSPADAA
jgi:hypothetical protein